MFNYLSLRFFSALPLKYLPTRPSKSCNLTQFVVRWKDLTEFNGKITYLLNVFDIKRNEKVFEQSFVKMSSPTFEYEDVLNNLKPHTRYMIEVGSSSRLMLCLNS